jgi:hypothetical protein
LSAARSQPARRSSAVVAERAPSQAPDDPSILRFDFQGRPAGPAQRPLPNDNIKQAIIRWLNEQL